MTLGNDEVLREYPLAESPVKTFITLTDAVFHAVCAILLITACVIMPIFVSWFFVGYMLAALTLWFSLSAWRRYQASRQSLPEIAEFFRTARRTEARVVDRWSQGGDADTAPDYMVAYAFTYRGPNGLTRRVHVAEEGRSLYDQTAVGDTFTVWYDPRHPQRCLRDLPFREFLVRHPRFRATQAAS